ncbi:hypothetical protein ROBYS_32220 [Roseobacter sp. OBYS 0001]|nr:hypothetical protein ROBYS_32220 [Roseobacter sp. OBYS 0001]
MSLALNIATITISGVYTAVSSAASAVGLSTIAAREASERLAAKKASREVVRKTTKRVSSRMARGATRNVTTSFSEAIPFIGVTVIAGGLALEVKDACDTARDMAGLEGALDNPDDPEAGQKQAMEDFECTEMIPEAEDLPNKEDIWAGMMNAPGTAWEYASNYVNDLPELDLSGRTESVIVAAGHRLEMLADWIMDW